MNKTVPWSIKGVGDQAREAAEEAARRSGVSLGEWLDEVIAERASRSAEHRDEPGDGDQPQPVSDLEVGTGAHGPRARSEADAALGRDGELASIEAGAPTVPGSDFAAGALSMQGGQPMTALEPAPERMNLTERELPPDLTQPRLGRSVDSRYRGAISGSLARTIQYDEDEDLRPTQTQKAMRALSEKLAKFERQDWVAESDASRRVPYQSRADLLEKRDSAPLSGARLAKDRSIREAVAEITRRQAALDADAALPPASDEGRSRIALRGAGLSDLNQAVSALEARLAADRVATKAGRDKRAADAETAGDGEEIAARPAFAEAKRPVVGEDIGPSDAEDAALTEPGGADPVEAFETLGRDLRRAIGAPDVPNAAVRAQSGPREMPRQRREVRDRAVTSSAPEDGPGPNSTLDEIRNLLDRFEPGSAISALEQRMEDLAAKIDRSFEPQSPSKQVEDLARQIDEIQSSIQGQVGLSGLEPGSMDTLVRGIAERIEAAREASADIQRLEVLIQGLADKVGDAPQPDHGAVSALEAQMARLGDRLERSEVSLSALDGLERSLGELFSQLEQTRHATIDAAETAARTAARETLRAAMQNAPAQLGGAVGEGAIMGQVAQELSELRGIQDVASQRTQSKLAELHQTMERLVEQLGRLEPLDPGPSMPWRRDAVPAMSRDEDGGVAKRAPTAAPVRGATGSPADAPAAEAARRPAEDIDPVDSLIEPGSGRAPIRQGSGTAESGVQGSGRLSPAGVALPSGENDGPASFIAAARRAAHAAQVSAAASQRPGTRSKGEPKASSAQSSLERARNFLRQRRRPILLSLAGLVLLLGALEVAKLGLDDRAVPEKTGAADSAPSIAADASRTDGVNPVSTKPALPLANAAGDKPAVNVASAAAPDRPASSVETGPAPASPAASASPTASKADGPKAAENAAPGPDPKAVAPAGPSSTGAIGRNTNPFLAGAGIGTTSLSEGLRTLALGGDPAAQYEVGLRLAEGRTVNRDIKAAVGWFEKAAAQGLAPAQYRLGSAYEKGIGQPRDPAKAMAWYSRAAEAGNMRAMHNLAVMAAEGAVGKPDYAKAASWFSKAAALGVRDSQFNLAILYARGLGIEQSLAKSYTWFAVAAAQGDEDAAKKRDEVGARLDAKALAAAKAEAENFRPNTAVSAANEVTPPPGGWDAAAPSRPAPGASKGAPKVSIM